MEAWNSRRGCMAVDWFNHGNLGGGGVNGGPQNWEAGVREKGSTDRTINQSL